MLNRSGAACAAPEVLPEAAHALERLERIVLIGQRSVNALAFARSCRARAIGVCLLEITDGAPRWRAFSAALAHGIALPAARLSTPQGLEAIVDYAAAMGARAIVADISADVGYLVAHRAWLEGRLAERLGGRCRLVAPTAEGRALEADKTRQIELARRAGFAVLPTWLLHGPADAAAVAAEAFPLCVRPQNLHIRPWFKVRVLPHRAALRALLEATDLAGTALIAQPFRHLPNLIVHGVRAASGEMLALQAFHIARKFRGVTLSMQAAVLPAALARASRRFVEACGVTGCFQFDLLGPDAAGAAYFLEINPRPGGTTDKVRWLGFDEPALTLAAHGFTGAAEPVAGRVPARCTVASKRTLLRHLASAARGQLTELDYPAGGRLRAIAQTCRELVAARDSVFDWRDLRGSFWYHARLAGGS